MGTLRWAWPRRSHTQSVADAGTCEPQAAGEIPVPDETRVADETAVMDDSPVMDQAAVVDDAPVVSETTVADETPVADEAPVPVETAVPDQAPVADAGRGASGIAVGEPFTVAEPGRPPSSWQRIGAGVAAMVFAAGTIFLGYAGVHAVTQPARTSAFDGVVVTPRILDLLHPSPPPAHHVISPVKHAPRPRSRR
jgi:hypothetical protein